MRIYGLIALRIGVDSIALDRNGEYLYYGAVNGDRMYRIRAVDLSNPSLDDTELGRRVEDYGPKTLSDGLTTDGDGNVYLSDMEHSAIVLLKPDRTLETLVKDPRLRWPDGFSFGPDGWLYVTCSSLQHVLFLDPKVMRANAPYQVFRMRPGARARGGTLTATSERVGKKHMKATMDHIVLNCRDIDRQLAFYCDVVGLAPERVAEYREGKVLFPSIRLNADTLIDLAPPTIWSGDRAGAPNLNHFCLSVDAAEWPSAARAPRSCRGEDGRRPDDAVGRARERDVVLPQGSRGQSARDPLLRGGVITPVSPVFVGDSRALAFSVCSAAALRANQTKTQRPRRREPWPENAASTARWFSPTSRVLILFALALGAGLLLRSPRCSRRRDLHVAVHGQDRRAGRLRLRLDARRGGRRRRAGQAGHRRRQSEIAALRQGRRCAVGRRPQRGAPLGPHRRPALSVGIGARHQQDLHLRRPQRPRKAEAAQDHRRLRRQERRRRRPAHELRAARAHAAHRPVQQPGPRRPHRDGRVHERRQLRRDALDADATTICEARRKRAPTPTATATTCARCRGATCS